MKNSKDMLKILQNTLDKLDKGSINTSVAKEIHNNVRTQVALIAVELAHTKMRGEVPNMRFFEKEKVLGATGIVEALDYKATKDSEEAA